MNDLPLSQRITDPEVVTPQPGEGLYWRPLSMGDVDGLVDLNRRISEADHPDWVDTREELLDEMGHSYLNLPSDSLAAVTDGGEIIAWGLVIHPPTHDTLVRSILLGGVAPSRREEGIGRALLAWQHSRARQQLAGSDSTLPGCVVVSVDERAAGAAHTLERAGFSPNRWFQNLSRATGEPIAEVALPDDVRVVGYESHYSADAHVARDEAFRGYGSSQPMSSEQWDSMMSLHTFAPEFSFVAVDSAARVIGLLLTLLTENEADDSTNSSGYVWVLGVVPDERHRGIASSMLARHLNALRDSGIKRSVLDVASDAVGEGLELYERMGFVRQTVSANYVLFY